MARLDFDGQVDCRVNEEEYAAMVSEGTVNLLQRGLQFGIPQTVIDEQIADAGRMVNAFYVGNPCSYWPARPVREKHLYWALLRGKSY